MASFISPKSQPVGRTLRTCSQEGEPGGGREACRWKPQKIREAVKPSRKKAALLTKRGTHLREKLELTVSPLWENLAMN